MMLSPFASVALGADGAGPALPGGHKCLWAHRNTLSPDIV
jgi:hypothetical protein